MLYWAGHTKHEVLIIFISGFTKLSNAALRKGWTVCIESCKLSFVLVATLYDISRGMAFNKYILFNCIFVKDSYNRNH